MKTLLALTLFCGFNSFALALPNQINDVTCKTEAQKSTNEKATKKVCQTKIKTIKHELVSKKRGGCTVPELCFKKTTASR